MKPSRYVTLWIIILCLFGCCLIVSRNNITIHKNKLTKCNTKLRILADKHNNLQYILSAKTKHDELKQLHHDKVPHLKAMSMAQIIHIDNINNKLQQISHQRKKQSVNHVTNNKPQPSEHLHSQMRKAHNATQMTIDQIIAKHSYLGASLQ